VKEPEAHKSLNQKDQQSQYEDGMGRGNVAQATDSRRMQECWFMKFYLTQTGKGENKCDRDVEQEVP
jgi:hypothetical protein